MVKRVFERSEMVAHVWAQQNQDADAPMPMATLQAEPEAAGA